MIEVYELLVRNSEWVWRWAKAGGCVSLGVAAVWRSYQVLNGLGGLYAVAMCVCFAFSMVGIGVHILGGEEQGQ